MPLSMEIDGLDKLMKDVKQAGGNAEPLVKAALFNSITHTQRNIRNRASHRTGQLQRSVLTTINYPSADVQVQEKYGEYIEYGTKPHVILPKKKAALYWKGAFSPYKKVYHPGTKARPFFKPGVEASISYINEQFNRVVERLTTELMGR